MTERTTGARVAGALITAGTASYATNAAFGAAVAAGLVDNTRIRWVHHALFVSTASLTGLAIAASALARRPAGLALLGAVAPLAALPFLHSGIGRHAAVAGLAAPAYAAAIVLSRRSR